MRAGVRRENVDGVETFWLGGPGPKMATLTFRVSFADETLYLKGITHMVEHLALQRLGVQPYSYNGVVDHLRTSFTMTGEPEETIAFLGTVCEALADLPLERFEDERRILLTENARHSTGPVDAMLALRYGPRGPGLSGYPELGLHHLTPDRVAEWARTYFRPENAVLWLTAPPPPELRLPLASGGTRQVLADTGPLPMKLPAWRSVGDRGVAVSSLHPRSVAASALPGIVERRLQSELRYERALAYEVAATYFPVAPERALSALWTDVAREHAAEARDVVRAVLDDLASAGPDEDEVVLHKQAFRKAQNDEYGRARMLDTVTQSFLMDPKSAERDVVAEVDAMTAEDVAEAARAFQSAAVFDLPERVSMLGGHERLADWSTEEVTGTTHRAAAGGADKVVVGENGITLYGGTERRATIWFDRCEAMSQWGDGTRLLYGADGFGIAIIPSEWFGGEKIVALLDEHLSQRAIRMTTESPAAGRPPAPPARPGWPLPVAIGAGFVGLSAFSILFDPQARAEGAVPGTIMIGVMCWGAVAYALRRHFRR